MAIHKGNPKTPHFLNVDLDIYSRSDLQPLVTALGKKVYELYVGRDRRTYSAHLELTKITKNADAAILAFCALIRLLPRAERRVWNSARVRELNIGIQAALQPHSYVTLVSAQAVKAAAEIGARIGFTVYAPDDRRRRARSLRPKSN